MSNHKSLTELAVRKQQEAMELRGTILAQSEGQHIDTLEREAAEILQLEDPPDLGLCGEVTNPRVTGLASDMAAGVESMKRRGHRIMEDASIRRTSLLLQPSFNILPMALDIAGSVEASNSIEKMLAHQMALCHEAAFKMMDRALSYEHSSPGDQVEACRCMNASARMMAAFQDAALALQKLRNGGSQTVTVQHVNVAQGGQAVVGNVQTAARAAPKRGGSDEK